MGNKSVDLRPPAPPALGDMPLVHASEEVAGWLDYYWRKLRLPSEATYRLAVTAYRQEFAQWTGRRLNPLALGCYCYLPNASGEPAEVACGDGRAQLNAEPLVLRAQAPVVRLQPALPGFTASEAELSLCESEVETSDHRHLIFIEPGLLPVSTEVTVAHELIHLNDRLQGHPRKHRCHGHDSISVDEAALTGRDPEFLRAQLREETARREEELRRVRPYRYVYVCAICKREYPRVRRYTRPVSCGRCDQQYNLAFALELHELVPVSLPPRPATTASATGLAGGAWRGATADTTAWGEARQSASTAPRHTDE